LAVAQVSTAHLFVEPESIGPSLPLDPRRAALLRSFDYVAEQERTDLPALGLDLALVASHEAEDRPLRSLSNCPWPARARVAGDAV
jgi:hypothetical protein